MLLNELLYRVGNPDRLLGSNIYTKLVIVANRELNIRVFHLKKLMFSPFFKPLFFIDQIHDKQEKQFSVKLYYTLKMSNFTKKLVYLSQKGIQ